MCFAENVLSMLPVHWSFLQNILLPVMPQNSSSLGSVNEQTLFNRLRESLLTALQQLSLLHSALVHQPGCCLQLNRDAAFAVLGCSQLASECCINAASVSQSMLL